MLSAIILLPHFCKGLDLANWILFFSWLAPGVGIQFQHSTNYFLKRRFH